MRDAVLAAIHDRAVILPGAEDGADCAPELILGLLREILAGTLADEGLETGDELLDVLDGELHVGEVVIAVALVLEVLDHAFERLVLFTGALLDSHDDVAVHLEEAAVAVPGKLRVAGLGGHDLNRLVVHAEVENGVHHAGHGVASARADREEERIFATFETLANRLLDLGNCLVDLLGELRRVGALVVVVVGTNFRGDREPGRHRQTDAGHLSKVGALAAEQRTHLAVAVGLAVSEIVDVFTLAGGCGFGGLGFFRHIKGARKTALFNKPGGGVKDEPARRGDSPSETGTYRLA